MNVDEEIKLSLDRIDEFIECYSNKTNAIREKTFELRALRDELLNKDRDKMKLGESLGYALRTIAIAKEIRVIQSQPLSNFK